ncbi:DUF2190 family protein [Pseudomonas schmalbachii]|uniref:DUF2190 family protein n=1 Tax=Pseudomonas schmalbachii TaxID=2816993 RepID=A0ABS3TKF8_9PSED|nr:DUF2190 family protein [Pseudomonas schmalbachii]MBO3274134.1 DUF2190 family protein [Pseudomonas schmalbachii]
MKNFIQCGDTLTGIAPAGGCVSGGLYTIGDLVGVAVADAAEGAEVELKTTGVFAFPKTTPAEAWTRFVPIFATPAEGGATVGLAGDTLIGYATEEAANPSSSGRVRLNGVGVSVAAASGVTATAKAK